MTDNRTDNPRFAFIPKKVWDRLLDVAPVPLAGIAVWYSLLIVVHVAEELSWSCYTGELEALRFAFRNEILIPTAIALGFALYFLVDGLFSRRKKAGELDREGFGRSWLLVTSATIIVAMLAMPWCLYIHTNWQLAWVSWDARTSVRLAGAWTIAAVTALGLRRLGTRFEAMCLLPPIAWLVAMLLSNDLARQIMREVRSLQVGQQSLIAMPDLFVLVTICLIVCCAAWAERRLFHSHQRAIGIVCASLWALAAAIATGQLPTLL